MTSKHNELRNHWRSPSLDNPNGPVGVSGVIHKFPLMAKADVAKIPLYDKLSEALID
jgi:hypothetical protein